MAEYREPGQSSRDSKVVKFLMQPKENPRLQDDLLDRMGSGVLPKMVKHLFVTHSVRLLGVAQSATFFMETSTDNWKQVLKHRETIQDVLKQVFSQEVRQLVQWEDVYEFDTNFTDFRLGGCPPKTLRDDDSGISPALEELRTLKELRVVLLGETGSGKSTLGNTLLGLDAFDIARGLFSGTQKCQWADVEIGGVSLQVTETPDLYDSDRREVLCEIVKSVALAAPGPHVVLMVLCCNRRFTQEEYDGYVTLKELFGDAIVNHMIVVFTGADAYGDTPDEQRTFLRESLSEMTGNMQKLLEEVNHRYVLVSNLGSQSERRQRAKDIMDAMIDLTKKNGGKYFSSKITVDVGKLKEPLIEKRLKNNYSRKEAARETNLAIVAEREDPEFFKEQLHLLRDALRPVFKSFTYRDPLSFCSVM